VEFFVSLTMLSLLFKVLEFLLPRGVLYKTGKNALSLMEILCILEILERGFRIK